MRLFAAILLGKLIGFLSKLLKIGGGSAAPGLYALAIDPDLTTKLCKQIAKNVVITGTNGKTTTARMLAHFAKAEGIKVIRNHTGSNLERGIASTLIANYNLQPITYNLGIWELDEAAFNTVAPKLKPDIVVFLNVFRDQLDRYGEIDTVVKKWQHTLASFPPATQIFLNGDDSNISKLAKSFKGKVQRFGIQGYKITGEGSKVKKADSLDFEAKEIKINGLNSSNFLLQTTNYKLPTTLPLPGFYHIYDFLAGFAAGQAIGLKASQMILSLKNYSPAFGRVERLPFGYIFLIKNPAGATQVFKTIAPNLKPKDRLLIALNDNIADGKDVSWIWDAEFDNLQPTTYNLQTICSGSRAYDLAVRLKYTGFEANKLTVQSDLQKALEEARKGLEGRLFILPTYTAMLELQSLLTQSGLKKHYWLEE